MSNNAIMPIGLFQSSEQSALLREKLEQTFRTIARSSPKISLIINTACADSVVGKKASPAHNALYEARQEILRKETIPRAKDFDEVIVAGVFPDEFRKEFPRVRFVPVPPQKRDRWDALLQRDVGARFATGDVLVFCHDDHAPGETLPDLCRNLYPEVDILVPKRIHLATGEEINNGREQGYMGGHCYAMRRWIWAEVPLTSAPDEYWDIYLTPVWQKAGARIVWTNRACHYDCESKELGDNRLVP
jgi:hypothetical protein